MKSDLHNQKTHSIAEKTDLKTDNFNIVQFKIILIQLEFNDKLEDNHPFPWSWEEKKKKIYLLHWLEQNDLQNHKFWESKNKN